MKKIFALLLAFSLCLCSSALAEAVIFGTVNNQPVTIVPLDGYTVTLQDMNEGAYGLISCEDEEAVQFSVSIAYSEVFADYTMDIDQLTDDQIANAKEILSPDFNNPEFTFFKTENGLSLLLVDETDSQSEYAYILTIYNGYFVEVDMFKASSITQQDIDAAATMLQSIRAEQ